MFARGPQIRENAIFQARSRFHRSEFRQCRVEFALERFGPRGWEVVLWIRHH
jgi:hypothetical protein